MAGVIDVQVRGNLQRDYISPPGTSVLPSPLTACVNFSRGTRPWYTNAACPVNTFCKTSLSCSACNSSRGPRHLMRAAAAIFGADVGRLHLQQLNLLLAVKARHQDFANV